MIRKDKKCVVPFAAMLASCVVTAMSGTAAAMPVITETDITDTYSTSEIMTAKQADALSTQIFGGPSAQASATATAAPLKLPATVGGGRVAPAESGAQPAGTRMVLLFNAGPVDGETACKSPARAGARKSDGPLNVFAVVCRGDEYLSQAHLRDDSVTGEKDSRYAKAMSQLFLAVMPPDEELEREGVR